ncbi:hypothetical protein [Kitasatospora phosalacinea]|uniref:Uncharacterized protein n=1 Tax=Kitasatospora phosalacinea TaxID=2065 RepID=A0A9W6PBR9_9ACTN|nr:hypothetical protein [Kitasatospora phosalacinea]GLW52869.1 hypothetical protein Kpho01_08800 [Kitasatospora phosalacinea]
MESTERGWDIAPEHAILTIDARDFSKVPESLQPPLKEAMTAALRAAFTRSGLADEWEEPPFRRDDGDGFVIAFEPLRSWRLVDPMPRYLDQELENYRVEKGPADPDLSIRMALHIGPFPVSRLADSINDVFRFVNSDTAKTALDGAIAHRGHTVLLLSDEMFRRVVGAGRSPLTEQDDFLRIPATNVPNKDFSRPCWVYAPRVAPQQLAAYFEAPGPPSPPALRNKRRTDSLAAGLLRNAAASGHLNVHTVADRITSVHAVQINQAGLVTGLHPKETQA